jgi:hypothetical protein
LPFFVVFLAEDFLVVDFLADFLAAMALGTSFLMRNVKVEEFLVNVFLRACHFFSAPSRRAISRARTKRRPRGAPAARGFQRAPRAPKMTRASNRK